MHVCLFDIDGTLIRSGGAGTSAFEKALSVEFQVDEVPKTIDFTGRTDRAIVGDLFRIYSIEDNEENWDRFVACYLRVLPDHLHQRQGRLLPGVAALLQRLAEEDGVAVGLLTGNIERGAQNKLEYYGIYEHFAFGGFGDVHRDRESVATDALAAAREHLAMDIPAERVYVIGDTPRDVRCARSIGARAVAVTTGWHTAEQLAPSAPDVLLEDLTDAEQILELFA